jgi:SAM-dependent methyltransferase
VLIADFFAEFIPQNARVLDLGCGWGEFINQVQAKDKFGLDLNPDAHNHLAPNVTHFCQDCSEEWPVEDASLDVVFTSNFFEHIPTKEILRATLDQAQRKLKPGGKIICMGPNIKYLPGKYWDFWDHFLPLTELSLREVLELVGFNVVRCHPRFLPYTMVDGIRWPMFFIRSYLKLPIAWPLFGRQFLVVAEKRR